MDRHALRCDRERAAGRCRPVASARSLSPVGGTPRQTGPRTAISRRRPVEDVALSPGSRPLAVVHLNAVHDVDELAGLPLLMTIRQAALVLDVCPAKAYEMAHRYEATGCEGLPVIRLDKLYRVPRLAFAVLVLTGRVVTVAELEAHCERVLQQLSGRPATIPTAVVEPDAVSRARSAGRRAGGRGGRSAGSRRAGSVEQLRLLPED
jgi:hypothetical protein